MRGVLRAGLNFSSYPPVAEIYLVNKLDLQPLLLTAARQL